MVKNQLFRINPDLAILLSVLETFGLDDLNDTKFFTKKSIKELGTVDKINDISEGLRKYYLPCKARNYLDGITEQKCITILRQFLKVHNYTLITSEKYIDKVKMGTYRLIKIDDKNSIPKKKVKKTTVISFE
jgi:hypothetical protein